MGNEPGTLSGTIKIAPGSRVDADTALDLEISGLESSRSQPVDGVQNPGNPFPGNVIAGGFVSFESGFYGDSREFAFPTDRSDILRINLVEGQRVSVNVFPAPFNPSGASGFPEPETSLTLEPVDNVAGSVSTASNTELNKSVKAQQNGAHDLTIEASGGGPARYVLRATSLSQDETLGQASMDFSPGEAIITMEPQASSGGIRAQAGPSMNVRNRQSIGGNQFRAQMPLERQAIFPASADASARKKETLQWIRELNDTPGVASAVPNHHVRVAVGPTTQSRYLTDQKWHYDRINAEPAWSEVESGGASVRIAVLDTGVARIGDDWHPDLAPNIDCNDTSRCYDAVARDGSDPVDVQGNHGTHVTGIAAADASQQGDVTGVAHGAELLPVRVLGGSEGSVADVIEGVNWVTNSGDPRADIINLSLGSQTDNPALQEAVSQAAAAGVLVVAASGNAGDDRAFYPAAYPRVLAVGAVDCQGNRSSFSNFGNWLDLAAPGGGNSEQCGGENEDFVFSTVSSGEPPVGGLQGTSMAAPHVAGVLGLMREKTPGVEMPVIRALLREGRLTWDKEKRAADGGFDQEVGRGIINAGAAVTEDVGAFAALAPDPERLRLDNDRDRMDLSLSPVGDENVRFSGTAVTENEEWLEVGAVSGERSYRVSLNRDAMREGIFYRSSLAVSYEVGGDSRSYQIPVTAILEQGETERNAGAHFVQLIPVDAANDGSVSENTEQAVVEARDGQYRFEFDTSKMEPGDYLLIAGSDVDNDGAFCGAGEACAEFPVTGQPKPIKITQTMSRTVELETAFTRPVDSQQGDAMPINGYPRLDQDQGE